MSKIKYIFFSIIIIFILIFVYLLSYTYIEPKAYDFMVRNVLTNRLPFDKNKNIYGHDDIVLVVVDEKSAERYRWPWKRDKYCEIFDYFLKYTNAKIIVHDANIINLDKDTPDADNKFFNLLSKFDNLIEGFMPSVREWENKDYGYDYDKHFTEKFAIKNVIDDVTTIRYSYPSVMAYPKLYFDSIKYNGSVSMLPGFIDGNLSSYAMDEIYRNHEYLINYKGNIFPSLAMRAYMLYNNITGDITIDNHSIQINEKNYKIAQKTNSLQMFVPIRFYALKDSIYSHNKISAIDIMDSYNAIIKGLKPIINPSIFNNKIVLIGVNVPTGTGLNDNKNTPISVNHPGVDIQATAIDNIIHNDFLIVLPKWLNYLIGIFLAFLILGIIKLNGIFKSFFYSLSVFLLYLIIVCICFYSAIVVNVVTPVFLGITCMIFGYSNKYFTENKNKEKVESALGKYMSEDVMKRILQNIDNLGLGGKKSVVTVLFSDIRGFTSMSENMTAQEVSELLNEYFSEMEPIVTKYNGIINKFIGDAVMAVFGEPINDENHPLNAVKCGIEMLDKVQELHKKWEKEGKPLIEIGIGINTGEVFVGNIGSEKRMEYTVIGDTVNLASRLESYNKTYKTKILISSTTYEASKDFVSVNKISDVEIRGKAHRIDVYEVVSLN